jgi:hypothetical protein
MRLVDLSAVYFALGLLLLVAVLRRGKRSPVDALLLVFLWPLYLPVLLSDNAPHRGDLARGGLRSSAPLLVEHEAMQAALASVSDPTVAALLPSPTQIGKLFDHIGGLDEKVRELDEVLSRDDLDLGRATRALREAEAQGSGQKKHAESVLASVQRLLSLRDRALRERDELLSLSRRLRLAVTVLRFSGGAEEDVGGIVAEIVGRVEGVREAFGEVSG